MVSNGMSNRRVVLKRPPVCISDGPQCGNCSLTTTAGSPTGPPNFQFQIEGNLAAIELPQMTVFEIRFTGGLLVVAGPTFIEANVPFTVLLQAPFAFGDYIVAIIAINSQNCVFLVEFEVHVV
jgi:hypothetical protein